MSGKKKEIVTLLTEAKKQEKPRDKGKRIDRRYFLFLFLFFGIVIVGSLAYVDLHKDYQDLQETIILKVSDSLKRAEQLEDNKKFVAARERYLSVLEIYNTQDEKIHEAVKRLNDKIKGSREVQAYRDKIQIKNLKLWRNDNELKIAGNIVNAGKRYLDEIEITIYCLDNEERPVCEEKIITIPSDGKPLRKYQKRKFSLAIPAIPDSAKEFQFIVSDIEFVEIYQ